MIDSAKLHVCVLVLGFVTGCNDAGYDLELHMPSKVSHIELSIDAESEMEPKAMGDNTYRIDLGSEGKAVISDDWPITRYQRAFIVCNGVRFQQNHDFRISESTWTMGETTTRTATSTVSQSQLDGSTYLMEIDRQQSESVAPAREP